MNYLFQILFSSHFWSLQNIYIYISQKQLQKQFQTPISIHTPVSRYHEYIKLKLQTKEGLGP